MRTESLLQPFRGKWKFDGETTHGFDEVDLRINEEKLIYILRKNGIEVRTKDISTSVELTDNGLTFLQEGAPVFFVSDAQATSMVCGELSGEVDRKKLWEVVVQRVE